jgi:hypothetical protein
VIGEHKLGYVAYADDLDTLARFRSNAKRLFDAIIKQSKVEDSEVSIDKSEFAVLDLAGEAHKNIWTIELDNGITLKEAGAEQAA